MTKQLKNQGTTGLALLALIAVTMGATDLALVVSVPFKKSHYKA